MPRNKILKLTLFLLAGLAQLILQTQVENVFQMSVTELRNMVPWISQILFMDQLTGMLQDLFVDSAVNRLMTGLGLAVSFWATFQNQKRDCLASELWYLRRKTMVAEKGLRR